jgi:hypothetical protein
VVGLATGDFLDRKIMTMSKALALVTEKEMVGSLNFGAASRTESKCRIFDDGVA